ncbi:hypothetical protein GE061_000143 [Apolygus lucorum]|uniref:Uncharacterized protein n=1 Tax=Apolygus lucorum TaxID=248454 RepID=A0A8S9Y5G8_APOLU|nr:hypothetical protein GE061_000143 [Apolygus lucorum]
MRALSVGRLDDDSLKPYWLQRLPAHLQSILSPSHDNLNKLAAMADKIIELSRSANCPNTVLEDLRADVKRLSRRIDILEESKSRPRPQLNSSSQSGKFPIKDKKVSKVIFKYGIHPSNTRKDPRKPCMVTKRKPAPAEQGSGNRSKKQRIVQSEPIRGKSVSDIPGIGLQKANTFRSNGTTQDRQIIDEYVRLNGDSDKFTEYMMKRTGFTDYWGCTRSEEQVTAASPDSSGNPPPADSCPAPSSPILEEPGPPIDPRLRQDVRVVSDLPVPAWSPWFYSHKVLPSHTG